MPHILIYQGDILNLYNMWLQDIYKTNVLKCIDKIEQVCYNTTIITERSLNVLDAVIRWLIFLRIKQNKCLIMSKYYNDTGFGGSEECEMPVARCTHCGKGISNPDEAMIINTSKNPIHIDCWEDYAAENYEEFLSEFYG